MRRVLLCLLLLSTSACSSFGHELCKREEVVSTALVTAGGYLGPPGILIAEVFSLGLGAVCKAVDTAAHAPESLGLLECEDCAAAATTVAEPDR